MARKTEKTKKGEMHTVLPGIWQETLKMWKMRNANCRTWNMGSTPKNIENETHTQ